MPRNVSNRSSSPTYSDSDRAVSPLVSTMPSRVTRSRSYASNAWQHETATGNRTNAKVGSLTLSPTLSASSFISKYTIQTSDALYNWQTKSQRHRADQLIKNVKDLYFNKFTVDYRYFVQTASGTYYCNQEQYTYLKEELDKIQAEESNNSSSPQNDPLEIESANTQAEDSFTQPPRKRLRRLSNLLPSSNPPSPSAEEETDSLILYGQEQTKRCKSSPTSTREYIQKREDGSSTCYLDSYQLDRSQKSVIKNIFGTRFKNLPKTSCIRFPIPLTYQSVKEGTVSRHISPDGLQRVQEIVDKTFFFQWKNEELEKNHAASSLFSTENNELAEVRFTINESSYDCDWNREQMAVLPFLLSKVFENMQTSWSKEFYLPFTCSRITSSYYLNKKGYDKLMHCIKEIDKKGPIFQDKAQELQQMKKVHLGRAPSSSNRISPENSANNREDFTDGSPTPQDFQPLLITAVNTAPSFPYSAQPTPTRSRLVVPFPSIPLGLINQPRPPLLSCSGLVKQESSKDEGQN